jgi:sialate O-acetylesterase
LYYFGVRLQEELDVPVGLICRAVSGSPALPWVSRESFASNEACAAACRRAPTNGAASVAVPNAVGEWHAQFIAPIAGYAIRGVLWDQGESGTGVGGVEMRTALGLLVASWRQAWQCGAFPFFYVQKPSGGGCAWRAASAGSNAEPLPRLGLPPAPIPDGAADQGGRARQSFQDLETVQPNMAMCIASDLDAGLHPFGKDEYGRRLAAIALNRVYGVGIAYDGPRYVSHRVESDRVRVRFRNVGAGLVARHSEELLGFAVAGADRVFHWAEARIEGADVLVRSAAVSEPVAVRYAWAASPSWANLFNAEGLPALAFRTDDWPAAPGR